MKWCILILLLFFLISSSYAKSPKMQDNNGALKNVDKRAMQVFVQQIEIYGRIAKPQTVFIIPGTDPRVDGIRIERRFFKDIFRNVEKSTLRKEKLKTQRNNDFILW